MNKSKIVGLVILAGAMSFGFGSVAHKPKIQNNIVLAQHIDNNTKVDNQTLTQKQVQNLKNKTITVNGMKFSGLRAVKIAPDMNSNEFAAAPGFNPNGFASPVNKALYDYELNPANDQAAMNEATQLHDGNPVDTCVFFQSSALRAIGQDVPDYIGYTTHLEKWLANNGWTRHTDFQYLQRGDICFASYYHTFLFMGWEDKAKGIAYVMGNESFTEPYYRNRNLNGQSPVTYGDNSYYQATCYWTYGKGYTGAVEGINPVHPGGYNAIGTATTTTTLNVNAEPNTGSSVLTTIPNGVTVPVIAQNNNWYEVYYNGQTGWIDGNYTDGLDESLGNGSTPTNIPVGDNLTVTSPVGLWLDKGPSINSGTIVPLPDGTPVKALAFENGWYKVNYEGTIGWIDAQYTSANGKDILPNAKKHTQPEQKSFTEHSVDGTVTVTCGGLWINKKPFANDGNIIVVPQGTKLHATAESSNGWYKVTYKGQTGWIGGAPYSKFVPAPVKPKVTYTKINDVVEVVADGLCLNSKPEPNVGTMNVLPQGAKVIATEVSSNGWYKVTYQGQTGWIGGAPYSKIVSVPVKPKMTYTKINDLVEVVAGGLCLNSKPEPNVGTMNVLPQGAKVVATEVSSNGWYKVTYQGQTGWIGGAPYSKVIEKIHSHPTGGVKVNLGNVEVTADDLYMNSKPEANDGIITVLKQGTVVPYYKVSNNGWYEVYYNGKMGWIGGAPYSKIISKKEVAPTTQYVTVTSPVGLWMNNGPSVNSGNIECLNYNTTLKVIGEQNGWYEVEYNGSTGWVDGQYVS